MFQSFRKIEAEENRIICEVDPAEMLAWRDARSATSVSLSFWFFLKGTRMVLFSEWSGRTDDTENIFLYNGDERGMFSGKP